jgi:outer membrane protein OmpA-like peptidoglycan-associated protein
MKLVKTPCHRAAWLSCGALALALAACAGDRAQARDASNLTPASGTAPVDSRQMATPDGATTIRLSKEIMDNCRYPTSPSEVPRFDVDQSTLRPRGRDILADVANCMKDGPLQNRTITIVGRADVRGSEEHNLALGANRAEATRNYLRGMGVPENKLLVISRGEEGASGSDADSMALDRRVDLVLGDATERSNISQNPPANTKATRSNAASPYADQSEGGPASGKVTGTSGPGTDSVNGK